VLAARADEIEIELHCGKGFYVRSLARDLARALGSVGHLTALRRTHSGGFDLGACVAFEHLAAAAGGDEQARSALALASLPIDRALAGAARVVLDAGGIAHARHGRPIALAHVLSASRPVEQAVEPLLLCGAAGELIALARYGEPELHVVRGLFC
jgi:tRNA pseudouridine55 synthase